MEVSRYFINNNYNLSGKTHLSSSKQGDNSQLTIVGADKNIFVFY